ncbi:MAG: hypothetical protein RBR37_06730 [Advenella sp.]|nr:hypothetical protein [Advenella sp.]
MRSITNNQELDDKKTRKKNDTPPLKPDSEDWVKNNLSWLSQSEYQRYLYLLEEETAMTNQEKTIQYDSD